jgi:hypothetical protein
MQAMREFNRDQLRKLDRGPLEDKPVMDPNNKGVVFYAIIKIPELRIIDQSLRLRLSRLQLPCIILLDRLSQEDLQDRN